MWVLNKNGTVVNDTSVEIIPTGIKTVEEASKAFTIFPNPASDYLNIRSNLPYNQAVNAELFNDLGQRVLNEKIKPFDALNLKGLPGGVYILQLNQLYSYKVVVTH